MSNFWDDRYSAKEYIYGTLPNSFFRSQIDKLNPGRLLLLAEGEGRNAVYAAKQGWQVDAIDSSEQARKKALSLAGENNASLNYTISSLDEFTPEKSYYDAVGIIFVHQLSALSKKMHQYSIDALKPGGRIILQVFHKEQLGRKSGGPNTADQMYTLDEIKDNFSSLKIEILTKDIVDLSEGQFHTGEAVVISFMGIK